MNQFDLEEVPENRDQCFFVKLLRECSMDYEQQQIYGCKNSDRDQIQQEQKKSKEQEKIATQEFLRWKGLEESDQQDTYQPEPQLVKAKSLRLQQERKISSFIKIFGKDGIDPLTGKLKQFSPQKHKKIGKARR